MIISVLKLTVVQERRQAVLETLREMVHRTCGKLGCTECSIYENPEEDEDTILYLEKWSSTDALHRHIKSGSYILLLTAMEFSSQEPEIYFHDISKTGQMDLIKALRGGEAGV
jgi:quinol monooxygenase YgiN